jgi:hypothetical protein
MKSTLRLSEPQLVTAVHAPTQMVSVRSNGNVVAGGKVLLPSDKVLRQQVYIAKTLYTDCSFFKGGIGELLLYGRTISSEELLEIEHYLQTKWNLPGK